MNLSRPYPELQADPTVENLRFEIQRLEEAVAARDTFIAVAAHELRNPMMPILGQLDLLRSGIRLGKVSLDLADQRLERLQRAVQQYMKRAVVLLDVSRINSGSFRLDPVSCDLAALLTDIAEEFSAIASHAGVYLNVKATSACYGLWDRLAVEQVVDVLLSNAIKYGGPSPVDLTLVELGESVRICVRDHGKGIPSEHRARIFERFERAVGGDEYRSGFGVGLWVVGQLVAAMQGSIIVEDAPDGGALFVVTLPKAGSGASRE